MAATPEVLWAQRSSSSEPSKNVISLTLSVPDIVPSALKLDLTPTTLSFSGHSDSLKRDYALSLTFFDEIDVDASTTHHTPKNVTLVLRKKEAKEEYWPRLLKDAKKVHYLKTDFDRWVDEDEQNEAPEEDMGGMGGMGGGMGGMEGMGGMPGMGDMSSMMGGAGGMGGIDFSKLGGAGMGGLGGMGGMGGMGDMDDEEEGDDDDDEEMPGLESEDAAADETKGKAKIEEVKE